MSDLFEDFATNMVDTYNRRVPSAWCTSHRDDPASSTDAAKRHEPRAASNAGILLYTIRHNDKPLTACELSIASGVERTETSRRLSDLHKRGLITKGEIKLCSVKQVKMLTWKVV